MFDITDHHTEQINASCGAIRRGAIVSCFYPLAEIPARPGPEARPALVIRVFQDHEQGRSMALVAYGTSRNSKANRGYEIRIRREESMRVAGLDRPTRFTLSRMRILPIGPDFFDYKQHCGPVLGYLDDALQAHLDATCERVAALARELRPLLAPTDFRVVPLPTACPEGGDAAEPNGHAVNAKPLDDLLQEDFIGRSDLARRLAKRPRRPCSGAAAVPERGAGSG